VPQKELLETTRPQPAAIKNDREAKTISAGELRWTTFES
jgi:hypothetical protein